MGSSVPDGWADQLAHELAALDGWLKLNDQAQSGRTHLSAEEEEKLGLTYDGSDTAHQYARVITRLINALSLLPEFNDGRGLAALQALRLDLQAIDEGNYPERLKPIQKPDRPGTSAGKRVYRAHVILCVKVLEEIGLSALAARKHVAAIFTEEGHRGQQGGGLSPDTLTRWREDILGQADGQYAAGRRFIERSLAEWRQSELWPPSLDDALAFIRRKARDAVISLAASK